jgi:L-iditol 2-dehydrogenase
MRALIKTGPGVGNLELLEIAPPVPGPGEALVRVGPSGLCGTDLLLYDDVYRGRRRPVPVSVDRWTWKRRASRCPRTGYDLAGSGHACRDRGDSRCGHCHHCVRGNYNLCQDCTISV